MLLRLAYPGVTNVFAPLRLLPMSNQDKDAEILALRHQVLILQRQLGPGRVRFAPADRALLAALPRWLPRDVLERDAPGGTASQLVTNSVLRSGSARSGG